MAERAPLCVRGAGHIAGCEMEEEDAGPKEDEVILEG